jgi:hypothetical protein
MQVSAFGSLD